MSKRWGKIRSKTPVRVQAAWVPPGQAVTVGDFVIPGGMVYVGKGLRALAGPGPEPALIDPSLPCRAATAGRTVVYLGRGAAYHLLPPEGRAGYLEWLARGRSETKAPQHYLFLFFCGIERRILYDLRPSRESHAEILALVAELERLLKIHRAQQGFVYSAVHLVALARLLMGDLRAEPLEPLLDVVGARSRVVWEIGPALLTAAGKALSPPWAFALWDGWDRARRATPAFRCPAEVRDLFQIRYREILPDGLRLLQRKAPLTINYHPASPSLPAPFVLRVRGAPEVRFSKGQMELLQRVADRVFTDLAPYSRWLGPFGKPSSPAALAHLPPELARGWESEESRRLVRWIETMLAGDDCAVVRREEIGRRWPAGRKGLTSRDLADFATFLDRSGYGMEPDPRRGSSEARGFFLFRLPDPEAGWTWRPGPAYTTAALVLQLAVAVATADGPADPHQEEHLLAHLAEAAHLDSVERMRLQIRLAWLLSEPQSLAGCREPCSALSEPQRRAVARFLITVAGADGHVSPGEIRQLKKVYRLLGRDPGTLYADIHALAAGSSLVRDTTAGAGLDLRQVEEKLAETEEAAALLGEIFQEDEPPPPAARESSGLDAAHAALLRELAARPAWDRADIDRLAARLGLLPDGALEALNEAAAARCGALLLEGEETLDLDAAVLEAMLA